MRHVVKLRNGIEESEALVKVTLMSLHRLADKEDVVAQTMFYDIVMKSRDRAYQIDPLNEKALQDLTLLQADGNPHNSIKNIVVSAVIGDGLNMKFQNPIAE